MNNHDNVTKKTYEYGNFTARVISDNSTDICAFVMSGSLDTDPIMEFRDKIKVLILVHSYDFIVDLDRVTYISSTALGFLMFLAAHKKNKVYLSTPKENVARSIKILGIHSMFESYDSIENLKEKINIPDVIYAYMKEQPVEQKSHTHLSRWHKILRDYLAHEQISEESEKLLPYIKNAEMANNITLPSDKKYTCVLFVFLEKVFRDIAKFDKGEITDDSIETIAKELMTNAVVHGYDNNKKGIIEASYKIDAMRLEISIIDYGKGFIVMSEQDFPKIGLRLLDEFFDKIVPSEAPKKEVPGLVLGKGTKITLIKNLIPQS